jgi:hypothetical protein
MNNYWLILKLSLVLVGCSSNGLASDDYYSRQFGDMDASYDDYVDFDEYRYYVSGATLDAFRKIDTSQDEKIDFFEWVEYQESQYPFESKRSFKYKGKSGIWYKDRYGNRYKDTYGSYCAPRCDYRHDYYYNHWHDPWPRHRYGYYWGH